MTWQLEAAHAGARRPSREMRAPGALPLRRPCHRPLYQPREGPAGTLKQAPRRHSLPPGTHQQGPGGREPGPSRPLPSDPSRSSMATSAPTPPASGAGRPSGPASTRALPAARRPRHGARRARHAVGGVVAHAELHRRPPGQRWWISKRNRCGAAFGFPASVAGIADGRQSCRVRRIGRFGR